MEEVAPERQQAAGRGSRWSLGHFGVRGAGVRGGEGFSMGSSPSSSLALLLPTPLCPALSASLSHGPPATGQLRAHSDPLIFDSTRQDLFPQVNPAVLLKGAGAGCCFTELPGGKGGRQVRKEQKLSAAHRRRLFPVLRPELAWTGDLASPAVSFPL